jgi:hypothetical protein
MLPDTLQASFTRDGEMYSGPRFTHLYRRWLSDEQGALTPVFPQFPRRLLSVVAPWNALSCRTCTTTFRHFLNGNVHPTGADARALVDVSA